MFMSTAHRARAFTLDYYVRDPQVHHSTQGHTRHLASRPIGLISRVGGAARLPVEYLAVARLRLLLARAFLETKS